MTDHTPPLGPLPEPDAFRMRYRSEPPMIGHYPWAYQDRRPRIIGRPEYDNEDLYTADQMRAYALQERAAVMAALQEADTIMGHDDEATEWRDKWAHLWGPA